MDKKTQRKLTNERRHAFLSTFFNQEKEHYEEIEVNGFYLVKQWNGANKKWEVAIYDPKSFKKRADFLNSSSFPTKPHDTATDVSSE